MPAEGELHLRVEVTAISDASQEIEQEKEDDGDPVISERGIRRTTWIIHNFKQMLKKFKPSQKISSAQFECDGDWYLDLFPQGYDADGCKLFPCSFSSVTMFDIPARYVVISAHRKGNI